VNECNDPANAVAMNPYCGSGDCRFYKIADDACGKDNCGVTWGRLWCVQYAWPLVTNSLSTACCLAQDFTADATSATAWCKPSWSPSDPQGDCEPVMPAACRAASVSAGGHWVHGFLGPYSSACGRWYQDALNGAPTVP
jgi:hypothetical protein